MLWQAIHIQMKHLSTWGTMYQSSEYMRYNVYPDQASEYMWYNVSSIWVHEVQCISRSIISVHVVQCISRSSIWVHEVQCIKHLSTWGTMYIQSLEQETLSYLQYIHEQMYIYIFWSVRCQYSVLNVLLC